MEEELGDLEPGGRNEWLRKEERNGEEGQGDLETGRRGEWLKKEERRETRDEGRVKRRNKDCE